MFLQILLVVLGLQNSDPFPRGPLPGLLITLVTSSEEVPASNPKGKKYACLLLIIKAVDSPISIFLICTAHPYFFPHRTWEQGRIDTNMLTFMLLAEKNKLLFLLQRRLVFFSHHSMKDWLISCKWGKIKSQTQYFTVIIELSISPFTSMNS